MHTDLGSKVPPNLLLLFSLITISSSYLASGVGMLQGRRAKLVAVGWKGEPRELREPGT